MGETTENIPFCRTCLSQSKSMVIFENDLRKLVEECIAIQLSHIPSDSETNMICCECKRNILDFHVFKTQLIEIESQLLDGYYVDEIYKRLHRFDQENDVCSDGANDEHYGNCDDEIKDEAIFTPHEQTRTKMEKTPKKNQPSKKECPACGDKFTVVRKLHDHIKSVHPKFKPPFRCDKCDERFFTGFELDKHLNLRQCWKVCQCCGYRAKTTRDLDAHMSLVHAGSEREQKVFHFGNSLLNQKLDIESMFQTDSLGNNAEIKCYVCGFCSESFTNKMDLRKHIAPAHVENKSYHCDICVRVFNGLGTLTAHISKVHADMEPMIKCADCDETFHLNDQMQAHYLNRHAKPKCPLCHTLTKNLTQLRIHLKVHPEVPAHFLSTFVLNKKNQKRFAEPAEKSEQNAEENDECDIGNVQKAKETYKCPYCARVYAHAKDYRYHMKNHTEPPVCACPACDRKFHVLTYLNRHMKDSHRNVQPQISCDKCPSRFFVAQQLDKHMTQMHWLKRCPHCKKKVMSLRNLKRHIAAVHTVQERTKCSYCEKTFKHGFSLEMHVKQLHYHGDARKSTCNICGLKFIYIKRHMLKVHSGAKKAYGCRFCKQLFPEMAQLRTHQNDVHVNEKNNEPLNYECGQCGKRFLNNTNLANHMKYHSEARPFECVMCQKRFKLRYKLTSHMRSHTDERPFACEVCARTFRQAHTLRQHRLIHTGERPYKCTMCAQTFTQSGVLNKHMKTHVVRELVVNKSTNVDVHIDRRIEQEPCFVEYIAPVQAVVTSAQDMSFVQPDPLFINLPANTNILSDIAQM